MPDIHTLDDATLARTMREIILEQSFRAQVGHIGSALSIADLVGALYRDILNLPASNDNERDRFVLSKGHAALALYAALYLNGWITQQDLDTYCADGSHLGVHPEHGLRGVDFATGSLGQGISMAVGAALAARIQNSPRRVFVVISDAECDEGSVWEAVGFAAQHRLANLIVLVDYNQQQAFGYTRDVMNLDLLDARWESFGWDVQRVDGHNISEISRVIRDLNTRDSAPHVLIANTTFGKGVSFMHSKIKWHYSPLSKSEFEQALQEIGVAA